MITEMVVQRSSFDGSQVSQFPLIRCADCAYFAPYNSEEGDSYGRCWNDNCPCQNQEVDMTWFCADGEPKNKQLAYADKDTAQYADAPTMMSAT